VTTSFLPALYDLTVPVIVCMSPACPDMLELEPVWLEVL